LNEAPPPRAAARSSCRGILPLRLVPFETYNLLDDSTSYPKTFVVRLSFLGAADRTCLERAWSESLARHPLLSALVQRSRMRTSTWIAAPHRAAMEWFDSSESLDDGLGPPIDLTREPGVRLAVFASMDRTEWSFRFHHACCDGLGAFGFIEDMLAIYAGQQDKGHSAFSLRPLDTARLRKRGTFEVPARSIWQQTGDLWRGIHGNWRWYRDEPRPIESLNGKASPAGQPLRRPAFVVHEIDGEAFRWLRRTAQESSATLNDLLLKELFLALGEWAGRTDPALRLSILMPASLRVRDDQSLPAANVMGFSFLTRDGAQLGDPAQLLAGIRHETEQIRQYRLSLFFLGMLGFLSCCPPLLARLLRAEHCFASAVLTNLGDPTRRFMNRFPRRDGLLVAGNLVLQRIAGVPPLRRLTRVVISAVTYGGKLTISLQADPGVFSVTETEKMLAGYVRRLVKNDSVDRKGEGGS
jgi:hypothetical protein